MTRLRHAFTRMPILAHRWIRTSLPGYVDGTLDAASRARVALHLSACSECLARITELRRLEALLINDAPTPDPSFTSIWLPLRDRVRVSTQKPAKRMVARVGLALALAALASSVGVIAFAIEGGRIVIPALPLAPTASASPAVTIGSRITPAGSQVAPAPTPSSPSKTSATPAPSASRSDGEKGGASPSASPAVSPSALPSSDSRGGPSPSASPSSDSHGGPSPSASPSPSSSGGGSSSGSGGGSPSGSDRGSPSASPSSSP